jgi:hypothetical protein
VLALLLASLVAAGVARADGLPVLGIDVGATGVVTPSGEERLVTIPAGDATVVARVGTGDGRVVASSLLRGAVTIPAVAYDGSAGGLSGDGKTLVLIEPRLAFPRGATALAVVDARRLVARKRISLLGDFSFDAVSPRGGVLYLIEYLSPVDPTRYAVRAYDVRAGRLLPEPVVDPTEPDEQMRGNPLSRATGAGGRWAYTLYDGGGEEPFVHALDTAGRTARCIDLPQLEGRDLTSMTLRMDDGGRTVTVVRRGQPVLGVDTRTFAVAPAVEREAAGGASFPWLGVAAAAGAVAAAGAAGLLISRSRRRHSRHLRSPEPPSRLRLMHRRRAREAR